MLPKISGGLLFIDRTPYHLTLTEDARPATTKMAKPELADWLVRQETVQASWASQEWQRVKTKAQTKREADQHRPAPRYEEQDLTRRINVHILISLIARPELNPIEMVWGIVKKALKRANVSYSMAKLKALVEIEFAKITADVWCRYEDRAMMMEKWYQDVGAMRDEV